MNGGCTCTIYLLMCTLTPSYTGYESKINLSIIILALFVTVDRYEYDKLLFILNSLTILKDK